jgi:DNA primase
MRCLQKNIINDIYSVTIMGANAESTGTTKYCIRGKVEIDGVVETPDVVGALFGQTEGLHFMSAM